MFIIVTGYAPLALTAELRLAIPLLVGITAMVNIALACMLYYGERGMVAWSPFVILAVALGLRLLVLFSPPQLSDDIYRYLWDGSNLLQGINPYVAAPSDLTPPSSLEAIHSQINHPDYVTIYPPAAQIVFSGGAALGGTVTGIKEFLVLFDMGLCALLILLLKRLEMPVWWTVLYAWNPLPVLEIAGSGHVDGTGLTMLIGSFTLLAEDRRSGSGSELKHWPFLLSGILMAGAGLVKLFPFILAPVLFMIVPVKRRLHFAVGFLSTLSALSLAFLPHLANMASSLGTYARNWEFAGFAFNTLRILVGSGTGTRLSLLSFFLLVVAAIVLHLARSLSRTKTPAAKLHQALKACYAIAMAFLLLTPTLQPWYTLSLAVFLPFCPGSAGLVLCWAVFLTYQVQIPYFILGQWVENLWVTAAVFLAPVAAFALSRTFLHMSRYRRRNILANVH
ncbi:MAG TPA: hypothetical protein VHP14_11770, partial [Anaerolineales bacterium]|nr:hypothetical protein [Anaerolineales bacterium]